MRCWNRSLSYLTVIAFAFVVAIPATGAKKTLPSHPSRLAYDSLRWDVPLGEPFRVELKSGAVAYIAEDHTLPLVKVSMYVRHGSLADPAGKEGLSSLLAAALRSGGTKNFPADTLDELIDLLALRMSFSAGESQFSFSGSFLAEYTGNAFTIMEELFFRPAFDKKKLERDRKIMLEAIKNRFNNPGPTLGFAFTKAVYARQAPARMTTEASLKSVTRNDLMTLHRSLFSPHNIIISIAGAFDRDSMKQRLDSLFLVSTATVGTMQLPKVVIDRSPSCLLVHREITQAYVRIGLPLFQRPHPDYYAMSLLNQIVGGGGFTSRLGKTVRSDAGLTYSIYSVAESNYTYPGTFYINFFTKNESFARAVALSIAEVRGVVADGVTDEELALAKSSLIEELPSMFRSPDDIVSTYAWNEYYGRSPDHFSVYPDKIRAITRDDLARVARQYLVVDSMTVVVVGDTTALLHQEVEGFSLSKLPRITVVPEQLPNLP